MIFLRTASLLAACLLLGTGCVSSPLVITSPVQVTDSWVSVESGLDVRTFETEEAGDVRVYRFEKNAFSWKFAHGTPQTIAGWAEGMEGEVAVANGVYFHEDMLPSGLLIADGERVGDRVFDLDKTAVLVLEEIPRIIDTSSNESFDAASVQDAAQSYPLLIKEGVPDISEDSGLTARRTAFGVDVEGNSYLIMTLDREPTLYGFAQALAHIDVSWGRVLNLDGGPSSGVELASDPVRSVKSYASVPNVVVAMPKH